MASTYTICFCGTACSRDEGEENRDWAYKILPKSGTRKVSRISFYDKDTGYIPVRIHLDISGELKAVKDSVTIRGPGENDWHDQWDMSDPLDVERSFKAPADLLRDIAPYRDAGQRRYLSTHLDGWDAPALALHAANLAAASGADEYNFIGHSRGAVEAIMAAWFLYAYSGARQIRVNIFAIDPVPGSGEWYGILTQLPPNVKNYVGVYAWDHLDEGFSAVVPRPNAEMSRIPGDARKAPNPSSGSWKTLADGCQLTDPIDPRGAPSLDGIEQPRGYTLYAIRGRHNTVAGGLKTPIGGVPDESVDASKEGVDASKKGVGKKGVDARVAPVPRIVYKLARAYLTQWGTVFATRCRVRENIRDLRKQMHEEHGVFDNMASSMILPNAGATRSPRLLDSQRLYVRRISSLRGRSSADSVFMEDAAGDPPFRLFYPCTVQRSGAGWVKWTFL